MKYHVANENIPLAQFLDSASDKQLQEWGTDTDCIERETCARHLTERLNNRANPTPSFAGAKQKAPLQDSEITWRQKLPPDPFDPRTEVSADAKHIASRIVKHLWILFVLLPLVAVVLLVLLGTIK